MVQGIRVTPWLRKHKSWVQSGPWYQELISPLPHMSTEAEAEGPGETQVSPPYCPYTNSSTIKDPCLKVYTTSQKL